MAVEIERKFLVCDDSWKSGKPAYFSQGYLNLDHQRTVRIRIAAEQAYLTVKGPTVGMSRVEYEYEVPVAEAHQMLSLCEGTVVEKNRYVINELGMNWEIDEFLGENQGLVIAEIELASENQEFELPHWIGTEVTDDVRYFNSRLSITPFSKWPENQNVT